MKNKTYFIIVSIVFVVVTLLHSLRIIFDWSMRVGNWDVPMWLSWLAVIFVGMLAYHGFHLEKKGNLL